MSAVDPDEIERCLIEYGRQFLDTLAQRQIVIDGKKLRGTSPRQGGTKGDYIMNAYVSENHIVVELTITTDNGSEFMNHEWLARRIGATVYFADPFCSGQKGAVENGGH